MVTEEYIVFVKAHGNPLQGLSFREQQEHIRQVGEFMESLMDDGVLASSQLFKKETIRLRGDGNEMYEEANLCIEDCLSGFYHLKGCDREEATEIVKRDPRLSRGDWSLVIKPVVVMDESKMT